MLYIIEAVGIGNIKIGFTDANDVSERILSLQTGCPVPIRLLGTLPGSLDDEKDLHRRFASSRVHGEWFKPTKELLSLVPQHQAVGGVSIAEQSVSIRILTLGRKQVTKALLMQLPTGFAFDLSAALNECIRKKSSPTDFDLAPFAISNAWGWVDCGKRWVLFEMDGRLFRHDDSGDDFRDRAPWEGGIHAEDYRLKTILFAQRLKLKGWRPEDQLFFGV